MNDYKRMSGITYNDALNYLRTTSSRIGLDGVKAVLAKMGDPHKKLKTIHVAGTNGKGSTCAYLQYILMEAGYRVGTFTSPHLHRFNERIAINGEHISDDDFTEMMSTVLYASENTNERHNNWISGEATASFFEILTCMAFGYFEQKCVDIAIIETGIGGRLDSTNVIEQPMLSVITAPGYDHQELLGETLSEIASEDAGIIKEGCPVAVYPTSVISVFQDVAKKKNAPLHYLGDDIEITDCKYDLCGTQFSVSTAYFSYQSLNIRLLGEHQIQNAIHALLCAKLLNITDPSIVRRGLEQCRWPGRFEIISQKADGQPGADHYTEPIIVVDGAHNIDGARIFKEAILRYFQGRHVVLVVGISSNKDYKNILWHMQSAVDTVVCTCSNFKAIPAEELAACTSKPVHIEEDSDEAMLLAKKLAGPDGVVAVAGSLYLVGDLRKTGAVRVV